MLGCPADIKLFCEALELGQVCRNVDVKGRPRNIDLTVGDSELREKLFRPFIAREFLKFGKKLSRKHGRRAKGLTVACAGDLALIITESKSLKILARDLDLICQQYKRFITQ